MITYVSNYFNKSMVSAAVQEPSYALSCSECTIYNIKRGQQSQLLSNPKKPEKKEAK